jgi:Flp pilus assembly protein TadD
VQDYLDADKLVLESARLNPEIFDAASERASFYRSWAGWVRYTRQQRTEEAWDLFVSACGRDPTNNNAVEGLSWVGARLYEAGDLDQARELYRQACMVAPERADFWNNYGLICRDTGHFEESFRAYRRSMALAPDDPRIINDTALILLYHLHRDLDQAEKWFIRGEDLSRARLEQAKADGDDGAIAEQRGVVGDCLCNLARLYSEQGRMQEAAENWNELRDVDATRPELPENGGEAPPAPSPPPAQTPASK